MRIKNSIKFKLSRGRRGRRGTRRIRKRTRQIRRLRRARLTRRIRQGSRQYMHDGGMIDITGIGKSALSSVYTMGSKAVGNLESTKGALNSAYATGSTALKSAYTTGSTALDSAYTTGSNAVGRIGTAAKDAAYVAIDTAR
jgi:hypothetical protein